MTAVRHRAATAPTRAAELRRVAGAIERCSVFELTRPTPDRTVRAALAERLLAGNLRQLRDAAEQLRRTAAALECRTARR